MWWKGKYTSSTSPSTSSWSTEDVSWSPSRSVSSFFDLGPTIYGRKKDDLKEALNNVLAEVNRTANMLSNAQQGGDERKFEVRFSDGQSNNYNQESFVIDPSMVMTDGGNAIKSGNSYYDAVDALNGRVIIGSQIRKNVTPIEYEEFAKSEDKLAQATFQSMQETIAYQSINNDWPGFRAYTKAHAQATHLHKKDLTSFYPTALQENQLPNIIMTANYNMLNPDDPIVIGDGLIDEAINNFNEKIGNTFQSVREACDWLRSIVEASPKPPSGGSVDSKVGIDSKSEAKGDKDEKENDSKDGKESKGVIPDVFDGKLLSPKPIDTDMPELADMRGEAGDACNIDGFKTKEWSKERMLQRNRFGTDEGNHKAYNEFVKANASHIKAIENCFLFEDTVPDMYSRGLSDGDLDENSLWKIHTGDFEFVHELKDVTSKPQHALGILLDQSGSMGGNRMKESREVVMLLTAALDAYPSIKKVVYGFTSQTGGCFKDVDMLPYIKPGVDNRHLLAGANAICNNIDGMAIKHISDELLKVNDVDNQYLFIISDGQPSGFDYDGDPAIKHTAKCVENARKRGIKVFGIGICDAFPNEIGNKLYGSGNFIVLGDTKSSLKILIRKIKSFLQQV